MIEEQLSERIALGQDDFLEVNTAVILCSSKSLQKRDHDSTKRWWVGDMFYLQTTKVKEIASL